MTAQRQQLPPGHRARCRRRPPAARCTTRGARSTTTTCATRTRSPPRLRDETPVFYAEELGYLVITRMEDIDAVFRNPEVYASANVQDPVFPLSDGGRRRCSRRPTSTRSR